MKIYISGLISAGDTLSPEAVARNKEKFVLAASHLTTTGQEAVSPLQENTDGMPWHEYMRRDLKLLLECDAIYMLENWQQSKGASFERLIAKTLGMPIYYEAGAARV